MHKNYSFEMLVLLFILGVTLIGCEAYVLLQVRKHDANHSNLDALIHKVVPSSKFDKFAARMEEKMTDDQRQNNRAVKKALETEEEGHEQNGLTIPEPQENSEPTLRDIIGMVGRKFAKTPSGPMFRSKSEGYLFKPETVHLRSGQSSVYSVHPDNIIMALNELLSSITLKKYVDKLSRKAAVVYRTVENDIPMVASFFRN